MQPAPLVLIPGLLCDGLLFAPQVNALAGTAECWIAECRGADNMRDMAQAVLRACPFERFALAGLSMGGYVALEIMRQSPERVDRLALLDTSARPDTREQTERRERLLEIAAGRGFDTIPDLLAPALLSRSHQEIPALRAVIRTMALNTGAAAFARQQRAIIGRPDSRPGLADIACPTLVLSGRQDTLTPPDRHEEMAAAIHGSELVLLEDCGHLSTLEQSEEVSQALRRWLEQN